MRRGPARWVKVTVFIAVMAIVVLFAVALSASLR